MVSPWLLALLWPRHIACRGTSDVPWRCPLFPNGDTMEVSCIRQVIGMLAFTAVLAVGVAGVQTAGGGGGGGETGSSVPLTLLPLTPNAEVKLSAERINR